MKRKPTLADPTGITRRKFVKMAVVTSAVAATAPHLFAADKSGDIPRRVLGRTNEKISIVGLGGYHIGPRQSKGEGEHIIRSAIDRGINFMDNCWDYNDGESEVCMGKALRDGYREKVFLMTKIDGRTKKTAAAQIDESLKRLQTDRIDLMQFHEIIRPEDPDKIFAAGAAMEAVLEAKKSGKVRFIGFTGHKDPAMHLRMLEVAEKQNFRFDAVQMPLNVMDAHFRSFEHQVVPVLVKNVIGILGMKPFAFGAILTSNTVTPIECLHYAMNLPTSTVITGCDSMKILDQAIEAARTFKVLTKDEVAAILRRTREAAAEGRYESFKTTTGFDGTAHHPEWLG